MFVWSHVRAHHISVHSAKFASGCILDYLNNPASTLYEFKEAFAAAREECYHSTVVACNICRCLRTSLLGFPRLTVDWVALVSTRIASFTSYHGHFDVPSINPFPLISSISAEQRQCLQTRRFMTFRMVLGHRPGDCMCEEKSWCHTPQRQHKLLLTKPFWNLEVKMSWIQPRYTPLASSCHVRRDDPRDIRTKSKS